MGDQIEPTVLFFTPYPFQRKILLLFHPVPEYRLPDEVGMKTGNFVPAGITSIRRQKTCVGLDYLS